MDDLVTWLRAQLDTDERTIERNRGDAGLSDRGTFPDYRTYDGEDLAASDDYLAQFAPPRMMAEVDAKRRILDEHHPVDPCDAHDAESRTVACDTLRLLALPYADRPGYRDEWKP